MQLAPDVTTEINRAPGLTEAVLESFERAARVTRFDANLFDPKAGDDLPAQLDALVSALKGVKLEALVARQGWRYRWLGADIEARLEFACSHQTCVAALEAARAAASRAADRVRRLEAARPQVAADQQRLTLVSQKAAQLIARLPPPPTPEALELHTRFTRRTTALGAVLAANALTESQIPAAISHLRSFLDRFADVDLVLFPVWERHALAMTDGQVTPETVSAAQAAARSLIDRLARAAEGQS